MEQNRNGCCFAISRTCFETGVSPIKSTVIGGTMAAKSTGTKTTVSAGIKKFVLENERGVYRVAHTVVSNSMAPREPEDTSDDESSSILTSSLSSSSLSSSSLSESSSEPDCISEPTQLLNQISNPEGLNFVEEEYHTDASDAPIPEGRQVIDPAWKDASDQGHDDNSEDEHEAPTAPLLPAELLKPQLPSPAYSGQNAVNGLGVQATRREKKIERLRSRQRKKRVWDWMQRQAKGTGVLEAGRVAQLKRGVVPAKNRVRAGRVEKKAKIQTSGRQQLLEQRKRVVGQNGSGLMRPSKKAKTKSK